MGHTFSVQWDHLFEDLADQFAAEREEAEQRAAIDDERLRIARLTVRDRLAALATGLRPGEHIGLQLHTDERVDIVPVEFGADWFGAELAGIGGSYGACLVPIAGVAALLLTPDQVERSLIPQPARSSVTERLSIHIALRDLARRRTVCELLTPAGAITGTIDRVARDHLDIAVHDPETVRRNRSVRVTRIVPLRDIMLVRIHAD